LAQRAAARLIREVLLREPAAIGSNGHLDGRAKLPASR
jgi:hypothetical protein